MAKKMPKMAEKEVEAKKEPMKKIKKEIAGSFMEKMPKKKKKK